MSLILSCMTLGLFSQASAQEGYPLKGSWIGEWKGNQIHGDSVLLVLDWDGRQISGVINPGTDNIEITQASLNPDDWSVRIEADTESKGRSIHYVLEGSIENLQLPSRSIVGTWRHQNGGGDLEISRQ
ncbi:MAG: hypothetical protein RQ899_04160 [Pseudomonadales bacterium]|nr:hypothetical protein [Pseudomonadales bacterium]